MFITDASVISVYKGPGYKGASGQYIEPVINREHGNIAMVYKLTNAGNGKGVFHLELQHAIFSQQNMQFKFAFSYDLEFSMGKNLYYIPLKYSLHPI